MKTDPVCVTPKPEQVTFGVGKHVGLVVQSDVAWQVAVVGPLRENPVVQLKLTTFAVTPLEIGMTSPLSRPLLGTFKVGHGKGEQVEEPVQFPRMHTRPDWLIYPRLHTGSQVVPLGLLMHVETLPNAGVIGLELHGLGEQLEIPLQTPATQLKVELAVKPLTHTGEHVNPLTVPAQWSCEP